MQLKHITKGKKNNTIFYKIYLILLSYLKCMFGSTFEQAKIDSRGVECRINWATKIGSNLMLEN